MLLSLRSQGSNIGVWVERGRQLFTEILRKRVAPTRARVPNESQQQQQQSIANGQLLVIARQEPSFPGYILSRFTQSFHTQAALLRRSAAMRMMSSQRQNVMGFAFVGLALASESAKKREENINLLPLDICCHVIKETFQKTAIPNHAEFPSDLASYDLCPQLLGKGCNASIYAARVTDNKEPSRNSSMCNIEAVSMGTSMQDSDTNGSGDETDGDFVFLNAEQECQPHVQPDKSFDVAIKMMFNYDVLSNALAISCAFEREYLPLQQVPNELCDTSMLQWENGNHVKKKKKKFLAPHPNIVAMYHVFAAPVDVHDLSEARELFPAALPRRMHTDGFGRNMTLFLVMKRYDMTLQEYVQGVGCQSHNIAMVIVAQLLEGVSHLVASGVAHRDLKSNNILVNIDPDGGSPHVVLADFGCCLADSDVGLVFPFPSSYTCIGGNTALMAPEVKLAEPEPGSCIDYSKSDAWAIGAIAYEVLGFSNPFYRHGNQSGLDSAFYAERDLPVLHDNTHPTLARVIKLLLRKEPSMRPTPQVAADMLHLSLWQPDWWKNACWESGELLPTQHHITNWLLHVSVATLDSDCGMERCRSRLWQNGTECQLCESWLSRVEEIDLMRAVACLHGICW